MRALLAADGIFLNTASNDEHVPEVERFICTIEERVRCVWNTLPFEKIPAVVVRDMVSSTMFWLNGFPAPNGVSTTMSPREIVTGMTVDYNKHCRIEFGAYAQTHEEHSNGMEPRTVGAIALGPTGNSQGGHYFMSLKTGRRLNRTNWTELPMPAKVINRVHALACQSKAQKGLVFADRNGNITDGPVHDDDEDDDDLSYNPDDDNDNVSISGNEDDEAEETEDGVGKDLEEPEGVYDFVGDDESPDDNPDPDDTEDAESTGVPDDKSTGVPDDVPDLVDEDDDPFVPLVDNNFDTGAETEDSTRCSHRRSG